MEFTWSGLQRIRRVKCHYRSLMGKENEREIMNSYEVHASNTQLEESFKM